MQKNLFVKVELALIFHDFLNMSLSWARRECNADRCFYFFYRKCIIICILCERLGSSFQVNNIFSSLMSSFSAIFWMSSAASSGFNRIGYKNIKMQRHIHHHTSCVPHKAAWCTSPIQMQLFCIRKWIFILNSPNLIHFIIYNELVLFEMNLFLTALLCSYGISPLHDWLNYLVW